MNTAIEKSESSRKNYHCVQAMRAVAAALVVLHHSIMMWLSWIVHRPEGSHWMNGASGVDIFFTISGFVMAISLPGLAGKKNKAGLFLWRRFTRVVPLYWGVTTLKVLILKLWPAAALNAVGTPWRIVASYLFIPTVNGKGELYPVVEVGWTLNYEVFFYLLFAVAVALELPPLAFLTPCLTGLVLLGLFRTPTWPAFTMLASSLVLEFLYGVILAHFATRRKLPGNRWGMVLLAGGFLVLMLVPEPTFGSRFLLWGLPAAAMVVAAVALEEKWGERVPKWLLLAGDASYSLYLTHTFVMPILGHVMRSMHITGKPALAVAIILGIGVSFPVAMLVHLYVEKPLMNIFKKRREGPKPDSRIVGIFPEIVAVSGEGH